MYSDLAADYSNPERCVIGGILNNPDQFPRVAGVLSSADFFADLLLGWFWGLILKVTAEGRDLRVSELCKEMSEQELHARQGELGALLAGGPICQNIEHYALKVKDAYIARRTKQVLSDASKNVDRDGFDTFTVMGELEKLKDTNRPTMIKGDDAIYDALMAIEDRLGKKDEAISTGIPDLDEKLNCLEKSNLIILAARPAMGKTAFAMHIATTAARAGKKVAFFTFEMSSLQIAERALATDSGVPIPRLKRGDVTPAQMDMVVGAYRSADFHRNIYYCDKNIKVSEIFPHSNQVKASAGALDLVVIDYLQLVHSGERMQNREREVSYISAQLKTLAKALNVPVVALAQLNRGVEHRSGDKKPGLSDLRDSGSIEQDADQIMFMYRESYYNPQAPDPTEVEVIVGKNRHGATGSVFMRFDPTKMRFTPK